ncbi:MAG: SusC/RagA family TonB-linked outer membrane protein [Prevotella sp.]|nr:SusC/RagA family TonB-linked outer membrane protein [Prevotella sp.]
MKRVIFAFLVIFMCSTITMSAQRVTMNLQQVKLEKVLSTIAEQTGYTFAYSQPVVNIDKIVSIEVTDTELPQVLQKVFSGTNISYEINNKKILLSEKKEGDQDNTPVQQSQRITVKGIAIDANGEPLIGASVSEKGTTNGTMTGIDGDYTLSVPANATLVITYVGYLPQEIALNGQTSVDFTLKEDSQMLDEIVVTALGIKKKEKSLTYSTQQVGNDDLTRVKDPNMINALAGKTAGVQINKSSSGLGGSSKVVIRGGRSLSGNNQPLYVIDGMPMSNSSNEQPLTVLGGTNDAGGRDSGDGIANLNPDDIESMNILKGPAAAALYGSEAANGVILITTKKGKAGATKIDFSSNLMLDYAFETPDLQKKYNGNWGEKLSGGGHNNVKDFFNTGTTFTNSIALSTGSEKMQTYFSYANTSGHGIVPNNSMMKHNLNFRETAKFFDDRLSLDANVNLMNQTIKNRPVAGGYYMNPLVGLYRFPQGQKLSDYEGDGRFIFNKDRNLNEQNWYDFSEKNQNPYWLTSMIPSSDKRNRVIASLTANLKVTDWLGFQARGSADFASDRYWQKMYVGTHTALAKGGNGRYIRYTGEQMITYGDVMATLTPNLKGPWGLQATIGASIKDEYYKSERFDSNPGGMKYANVFTLQNLISVEATATPIDNHSQMQSVFGTAQLSFNDYLFLDVTARNDWSSNLAFTNSTSFFYPSVGLTAVLSDMVQLPKAISFAKLRGAWSQVGNTVPIYSPGPAGSMASDGGYLESENEPFGDLKPEKTTSIEVGTEWRFLQNRIDFDFTYYKTNTKNQFFLVPAPAGSGYVYRGINGGDIQNQGIEIMIGGSPVMTDAFMWKTSFNYSLNKNKVKKLHPDLPSFILGNKTQTGNYQMVVTEGGSVGDIYGIGYQRDDNGNILYENGLPLRTSALQKVGNSAPKYNLGWSNTFTYKNIILNFLIDMRVGGDVLSITQADLDYRGSTQVTADARDQGYVMLEGTKINDVKGFYQAVSSEFGAGLTEHYMYDATNIRLRELSIGYRFSPKLLLKTKTIKGAELAFVARNLFFFKNNAPFDPDAILSTGNDLQGVDAFGMPSTRSFGFNLKLSF